MPLIKCILTPMDTLFFRNGMPFMKGISNYIESLAIPNPSTVYGALFTELMHQNEMLKERVLNNHLSSEDLANVLTIKNIYLYNNETKSLLISTPNDIFEDTYKNLHIGKLIYNKKIINSSNNEAFLTLEDIKAEKVQGTYLSHYGFLNGYIKEKMRLVTLESENQLFNKLIHTGIELDSHTGTVKEEHLYMTEKVEWSPNIKLCVEFQVNDEYQFLPKGIFKLGGESKWCHYNTVNIAEMNFDASFGLDGAEGENGKGEYIKLLVLSPLKFKTTLEDMFHEFEILASITHKLDKVGGYDYKAKKPKPMENCIMPGAIFYLKSNNGSSLKKIEKRTFGEETYKGFGTCLLLRGEKIDEI